jgi:hypothetical protein
MNTKRSYALGSKSNFPLILALVIVIWQLQFGITSVSAATRWWVRSANFPTHPLLPAVCPPSIGFGETIQCAIVSAGEIDSYTFSGNAGDRVYVRMSKSSGSLWPHIIVQNPDGTYLCGGVNVTNHATASTECTLPSTGTYTILADDYNGTATGDYYLYLQRLNNPGNAQAIAFGQTLPGTISTPAQSETYTFTASAGDRVYVRLGASSGSLWPHITVYNPDGTYLCGAVNVLSRTSVSVQCNLASTGTYTILADDYNGTGSGDYYIYLQRLNNPGSPLAIAFGETLPGSIMTPAQNDTYTFAGSAGDKVLVSMSRASGSVWPYIGVYQPDGTSLCGAYNGFNSTRVEIICTLSSTGNFTILVNDYDGTGTGDYYLYTQRLNNPGNASPAAFGETVSGSINTPAQKDTYTFNASAGDMLLAGMSQSSDTLTPEITMYGPDGSKMCNISRSFINACPITEAGSYTILADDFDGIYTGAYYLYMQRLNNPVNAAALAFGGFLPGEITMPAEMDAYTFTGSAGDKVLVRMGLASGTLRPRIRAYSPAGTPLCSTSNSSVAEIDSCTLTATGSHTILVGDDYRSSNGIYYLSLQRLNNPGNAASIAFGQALSGSIQTLSEIDTFTFTAAAGDQVLVRMSRSTGSLWPEIKVYGPDGTQVCGAFGYAVAEIAGCTLADTGSYTILADDYFETYTGDYGLYLQWLNNPGNSATIYLPLIRK